MLSALKGTIFPFLRRLFIYTQSDLKKDSVIDLIGDRHPKLEEIWVVSVKSGERTVHQTKNDLDENSMKMTTQQKQEPKEEPKELKKENVSKEVSQSQATPQKVHSKEEIDRMRKILEDYKKELSNNENNLQNMQTIIDREKTAEEAIIKHFKNRYLHLYDYKITTIEDDNGARLIFSLYTTIKEAGTDLTRRLYICYYVKKGLKPLFVDSTQSAKYHVLISTNKSFSISVPYGITYAILYDIIHAIISTDMVDSSVSDLVLYSNYLVIPTSDDVIPEEFLRTCKVIVPRYNLVPIKEPRLQEIIDSNSYQENMPLILFGNELNVNARMDVLFL